MGKVIVSLKLTNQVELFLRDRAQAAINPRSVEIEALVDTGATRLYLKPSVIQALGLQAVRAIQSRTTNDDRARPVYDPVRLEGPRSQVLTNIRDHLAFTLCCRLQARNPS